MSVKKNVFQVNLKESYYEDFLCTLLFILNSRFEQEIVKLFWKQISCCNGKTFGDPI